MKTKLIVAAMSAFALLGMMSCNSNSPVEEPHRIGIAAHRGYWNCEDGGYTNNCIASLRTAQVYGFWGSELDVHLTTDEVLVVYHDDKIGDKRIDVSSYAELQQYTLKNGEKIPTLGEYLAQTAKSPKIYLVLEFKSHPTAEQEDKLVDLTFAELKNYGLYDPQRIVFISFSKHVCDVVAVKAPEFANQYLSDDYSPDELAEAGINGIDFHYSVFEKHPEWYDQARSHGMSVNIWTVNKREDIENAIKLGVDYITTDEPELVRAILKEQGVAELQ